MANLSRHEPDASLTLRAAGEFAVPTGEALALEHAYARYVVPIYRFLYSRLGNQEEAEDLTSEVFVKAVRQLEPHRDDASVAAWLYQVARTTLADYWRRRNRTPEAPLGQMDVPEVIVEPTSNDPQSTQLAL